MGAYSSDDWISRYWQPSAALEALPPHEELALVRAFQDGDAHAGERLVAHNVRTVISIAREYRRWGIALDDLVQQGSLGLLHAARRFDPKHAASLRTYAAYWVRAEIRDYVVRFHRIVRLGTTRTERRALRAYRSSAIESAEQLAAASGMPAARCELLWGVLTQRDRSLDQTNAVGIVPRDLVRDEGLDPETQTSEGERHRDTQARASKALSVLTERERCIVHARMMSDEPETLDRLGTRLGVSRERVRQLESRARKKMYEALVA